MASSPSNLNAQITSLMQTILSDPLHGKKIYLPGSAEFGPTNEPVKIKSTVGLYNKFGKQGTLINAFKAIKYTTTDAPNNIIHTNDTIISMQYILLFL